MDKFKNFSKINELKNNHKLIKITKDIQKKIIILL
jgi:hypothetical protein